MCKGLTISSTLFLAKLYLLQYTKALILITLHVGTLEDLFPEVSRLDPAAIMISVGRGLPNLNLYLSLTVFFPSLFYFSFT